MNSKLCRELRKELDLLHNNYDALYEHMISLSEELKRSELENEYRSAFISYRQLDEEYEYFRANSHHDRVKVNGEDLPFDTFTLD